MKKTRSRKLLQSAWVETAEVSTKQQLLLANSALANSKCAEQLLLDTNDNLRKAHAAQSAELCKIYRERDDWRDAFKLIMRLVK